MSNLRLINETTISASASTVQVTDLFSADFDIYKITIENLSNDSAGYLYGRLINSSGSVITASSYDNANLLMDSGASWTENRSTGQTSIQYLEYFGTGTTNSSNNALYIFNPFSTSTYTFFINQGWGHFGSRGNGAKGISVLKNTSSITGFELSIQYNAGINLTGGVIRTYGLRVDS